MMKNIKYKVCSKCGEEKELNAENWHRNKDSKDGYRSTCKVCRSTAKQLPVAKEGYKYCSKCGEEKELTAEYWHKQKLGKYGYKSTCKECRKITSKEYRENNKEKIAEYQSKYYEKNKEYFSEYNKQYGKEYRAKNKEYFSEYYKQYYQTEQGRENYARARQIRRDRINSLPNTLTTEEYEDNLDHFDYKCAYCECELTPDNHHMEHVYPISRGVYGTTKENCIPSCESCNSSKHAKTLAEWYVWTDDYSFERLLKIHEITSGGKEWIVN